MMPVTRENVKRIADQVLAKGGTKLDIDFALFQAMNVMMGEGGKGSWEGWPACRYCDASGGGGHAGLCPAGYDGGSQGGPVASDEAFTVMKALFTGLRRAGLTVPEAAAVVAAVLAAQSQEDA